MREQLATVSLLSAALAAFLCIATTARAEIGPCKPDVVQGSAYHGLICGEGIGGARIIDGTLSPNKALALAWRAATTPPNKDPGFDALELLVVRVANGEILFRTEGDYWENGEGHINRNEEFASWSSDSRFMVESFHSRWDTEALRAFAFDFAGNLTGKLDLLETAKKAVIAKASRRMKRADGQSFAVHVVQRESFKGGLYNTSDISISNDGRVSMLVYLWAPKEGPLHYYRVTAKLNRAPKFTAKLLGVVEAKKPPD